MAEALDDFNTDPYEDVLRDGELFESYSALFSLRENTYSNFPSIDIGDDFVSKDTRKTDRKQPNVDEKLKSTNQQELLKIRDVVGNDPVSSSKLQIARQWILDYAIETEMSNYEEQNVFPKLSIKSLSRNSNIISSHHFFKVKYDADEQSLKLKCLVHAFLAHAYLFASRMQQWTPDLFVHHLEFSNTTSARSRS